MGHPCIFFVQNPEVPQYHLPMPSGLKRYQTSGHDHFVTFTCYHRFPYLDDDHSRTVFEEVLEATRQRHSFQIFGYVVMPEHVHLLLSEPPNTRLEDVFRALKTQTSRKLKGDRPQFWQRRYHDFNVFTQPKFREKLRYMHRNPVKRGLVENPEDWPWSSYRHWLTGESGRVTLESDWTWNAHVAPAQTLSAATQTLAN
jgi:putative transposase